MAQVALAGRAGESEAPGAKVDELRPVPSDKADIGSEVGSQRKSGTVL